MRIIEGSKKARQLVSRRGFLDCLAASAGPVQRAKPSFREEAEIVNHIIDEVREGGDRVLLEYTKKLDGVNLHSLETRREEIALAYQVIDPKLLEALKFAAERITRFHLAHKHNVGVITTNNHLQQRIQPLDKVGLYVPGGTAAYPSSVLMMAIPAKVAGVREIIMVSPPGKDGHIPPATLVAADIAQVDRIFKVGGAQAIAALAFGTESIPKVDKICGPGNIFVTLAKKAVYGTVGIDGLQGPSEIVIIADEKADPVICAADLLAQAEHDPLASVILITNSTELLNRVEKEINTQMGKLQRKAIIAKALDAAMMILVDNLNEAVDLVNLYAPEHLSLMVSDVRPLVDRIRNAGCIFCGQDSPVALGDYLAGPSHVLPTGGSARFSSPLSVADFLKVTNIIALDKSTMRELSQAAMVIARAEGLDAHAQSLTVRIGGSDAEQNEKTCR